MAASTEPTGSIRVEELILHIGSAKTGTSTIQNFLAHNRPTLAAHGVLYPVSPGRRRHARLSLSVKTDEVVETMPNWLRQPEETPAELRRNLRRDLVEEVARARPQRLLVSDEALFGLAPDDRTRLAEFLGPLADRVTVVVYLRRQDDHLRSRYQQIVKTGGIHRLADHLTQEGLDGFYDYRARLEPWRSAFPGAELVVRRFERGRFPDGSLTTDFLQAAGLADLTGSMEHVASTNESLDAESVEFLRLANLLRVEQQGATPGLIVNRPAIRRLATALDGPVLTLPDAVLDGFMGRFAASNRALAEAYLDDGDDLFGTDRRRDGTTTEQRLDPARVGPLLEVAGFPPDWRAPLTRLAEREAVGAGY